MGGNPGAAFFINMAPDTTAGGFAGAAAPLRGTPKSKGTHGYFPQAPNLRSTFMIVGKDVPAGTSLGQIDMRSIAPTLAAIIGVKLDGAEVAPIELGAKPQL